MPSLCACAGDLFGVPRRGSSGGPDGGCQESPEGNRWGNPGSQSPAPLRRPIPGSLPAANFRRSTPSGHSPAANPWRSNPGSQAPAAKPQQSRPGSPPWQPNPNGHPRWPISGSPRWPPLGSQALAATPGSQPRWSNPGGQPPIRISIGPLSGGQPLAAKSQRPNPSSHARQPPWQPNPNDPR